MNITCLVCGRTKFYTPSDIKRGRGKYCSRACAASVNVVNLGERMNGRKHSEETRAKMRANAARYKGGVTPLIRHLRTTTRYKEWRTAVYERDGYDCQDCHEEKSGRLTVHHIIPLSVLISRYNIRTIEEAMRCEPLWDVSNGVTLCIECHAERDPSLKRFGGVGTLSVRQSAYAI